MVKLHIKHGEESQFLYETTTSIDIKQLTDQLTEIYNGRLKVQRLCSGWKYFYALQKTWLFSKYLHTAVNYFLSKG